MFVLMRAIPRLLVAICSNDSKEPDRGRSRLIEKLGASRAENYALPIIPVHKIGAALHLDSAPGSSINSKFDLPVTRGFRRVNPEAANTYDGS